MIPFKGRMINGKKYTGFLKNFQYQLLKNYPDIKIRLSVLPRPLLMVLHIYRYRNDDWDIDNRITTVQDCLVKCKIIDSDSHKILRCYPGNIVVDKNVIQSPNDDYFEIEFVKTVNFTSFD